MDQSHFSALAFALVLLFSGLVLAMASARARSAARGYARLAAVLYVALALAELLALADTSALLESVAGAVTLMACALAPAALALALADVLARAVPAWLAAAVLFLGCGCGLVAEIMESLPFALAPLALSALAIFLVGLSGAKRRYSIAICLCLSALSLLAGAGALSDGSREGHAVFTAAALLGIAYVLLRSDARVEKKGADVVRMSVTRKR